MTQRGYNATTAYIWMIWFRCYKPGIDTDAQSRWQVHVYGIRSSVNAVWMWMSRCGCTSRQSLSWFDCQKFLEGGEQMIERAIRGLMRQDNSLYIFSDRPLLNTVIVKMKNPFHKTTAMFIMSLCGSAAFLLSYHGIFLLWLTWQPLLVNCYPTLEETIILLRRLHRNSMNIHSRVAKAELNNYHTTCLRCHW